jgi:hypothetical protein
MLNHVRHAAATLRPLAATAENRTRGHHPELVQLHQAADGLLDVAGGDDITLADDHDLPLRGPGDAGQRLDRPLELRVFAAQAAQFRLTGAGRLLGPLQPVVISGVGDAQNTSDLIDPLALAAERLGDFQLLGDLGFGEGLDVASISEHGWPH